MSNVRAEVDYRLASQHDLDGVVAVFLACWRHSYESVLPSPVIAAMTDQRARELWTPLVRDAPGGALVATSGDQVLGITRWTVDVPGAVGSIGSLYVDPDAQGAGVGAGLLERAVAAIAATGAARAALWVFEPNHAAREFYAHHAFRTDGTTRVEAEFGVRELRFTRPLDHAP